MDVAIGVDSHKASLAGAVVDSLGRVLEVVEVNNDAKGHHKLLKLIRSSDGGVVVGIEGSGSYGAGLARTLVDAGVTVVEVPAHMTHRERRKAPSKGKCDGADAVAIARVVARDKNLPRVALSAALEDLKLLSDRHDVLKRAHTATVNRIHKNLVVARPGYHDRIGRLATKKARRAVIDMLHGDHSVRAQIVRQDVDELARLDRLIDAVRSDIETALTTSGTTLTQMMGLGPLTAAKILGELCSRGRVRSKAAFAMLNGTAPVPASSGSSHRHHRLNRGGNRQLNYALHCIAVNSLRFDPRSRAYRDRLIGSGKSKRDAMRCLKRQISNAVFRQLSVDWAHYGLEVDL